MIPTEILSDGYVYFCEANAWLGPRYLGEVPIIDGSVAWTVSQQVQGTLDLQVPRIDPETDVDWTPSRADSPLAAMGQKIIVTAVVRSIVSGAEYREPLGVFTIVDSSVEGARISVTGKSQLWGISKDSLTAPIAPSFGSTLGSEFRRLIKGRVGLTVSGELDDRTCPTSMTWGESRIDSLYEIADAWPARLREGRDGLLSLKPVNADITAPPARALTDGESGTVVQARESWSRDGVYNRVIARGQADDDAGRPAFQVVVDQMTGPLRVTGPFRVQTLVVTSPLITSLSVGRAVAAEKLNKALRRTRTIPVVHAPDPSIQLDEPVAVTTRKVDGTGPVTRWGRVVAVQIPLTYEGTARTDVEVIE